MTKQIHVLVSDEQYWDWKQEAIKLKLSMKDFVIAKVEGEC